MKKSKILVLLLAIVMTLTVFTGCGNKEAGNTTEGEKKVEEESKTDVVEDYGVVIDEDTVTFTDARDKEVTIKKNPERVVCLFNSYMDIWYKCGGEVIGRIESAKEKPVEGSEDAEIVGTNGEPSLEKIMSLEPDLVIGAANMKTQLKVCEMLEESDIDVILLHNEMKEEYFKTVRIFSALTDRDDLYEKYEGEVRADIDAIVDKVSSDENPKVLLLFGSSKGISVRGSNSTVGQMLKDLNTVNISDIINDSADSKTFSMEKIIEEDPDFIFVQTMGKIEKVEERLKKDVESNSAWSSLKAVKNDRYIILPKDLYLYKPNDRYGEAYEGLAKMLYPDVFN